MSFLWDDFFNFKDFTFNMHFIIHDVFNCKVKHCSQTYSESLLVSHYHIWECAFCEVNFDFFIPLTSC